MRKPDETSTRQFDYEAHASYREIADELGLSQQSIRMIEKRALNKIKKKFEQKGINATAVDEFTTRDC